MCAAGNNKPPNGKAGDHAIDVTTGLPIGRMLFGDPVHARPLRIDLSDSTLSPSFFFSAPQWLRAPCAPALQGLDYLGDGGTFGSLQHLDQLGLLAVGARPALLRGSGLRLCNLGASGLFLCGSFV
jgi:hypothetical protein